DRVGAANRIGITQKFDCSAATGVSGHLVAEFENGPFVPAPGAISSVARISQAIEVAACDRLEVGHGDAQYAGRPKYAETFQEKISRTVAVKVFKDVRMINPAEGVVGEREST